MQSIYLSPTVSLSIFGYFLGNLIGKRFAQNEKITERGVGVVVVVGWLLGLMEYTNVFAYSARSLTPALIHLLFISPCIQLANFITRFKLDGVKSFELTHRAWKGHRFRNFEHDRMPHFSTAIFGIHFMYYIYFSAKNGIWSFFELV